METIINTIAVICLILVVAIVVYRFIRVLTSDKMTFVKKDGTSITISSKLGEEDRAKLLNF